ncbi:MAG: prepilin peptidase [Gemmataceae bacterium]
MQPFFPNIAFAWSFFAVISFLLMIAAFVDFRSMRIPHWITVTLLILGILINVVRGAWMGRQSLQTWVMQPDGLWLGAVDGLLFSLVGCVCSFAFFFTLWLLGACGGGDVKLCAAIGAWVGVYYSLWVLLGSVTVVILLSIIALVIGTLRGKPRKILKSLSGDGMRQSLQNQKENAKVEPASRLMTFSLPLCVATSLVLLWFFRFDLQLVAPPPPPTSIY